MSGEVPGVMADGMVRGLRPLFFQCPLRSHVNDYWRHLRWNIVREFD